MRSLKQKTDGASRSSAQIENIKRQSLVNYCIMGRIRKERELWRPKITVIGEGVIERWYFNHMRSVKGFKYDCKPRFFSEQSYSEMEKLIDSVVGQGGFAVCVCDADVTRVDDAAKSGLTGMKEKYKDSQDVLICDSMPSIEFWFLIHYLNIAKYFTDSKAVISKLWEWLPEYRQTGRFLEKRKWVEDLCRDGRLEEACVRASAMKEDSQSYSNVYKAITLFASQER